MRVFLLTVCAMLVGVASSAYAHCGKPHPEAKEKSINSRPEKQPE